MRNIDTSVIGDKLYSLIIESEGRLSPSCMAALRSACEKESFPSAKFALQTVLENARVSRESGLPLCQDTGMAVVILEIGQSVSLTGEPLADAVNGAVKRAYQDGYFRKSVCDPITRVNTTDNTPAAIHTDICPGDRVKISFLPKGFGSENMSRIYMLKPSQGVNGIIDSIVETVSLAASRPCPPVFVGVGIGSTFDGCAYLAKKALLNDVGSHSDREDIAYIEEESMRRINALGIGAQGFGGDTTAIGVRCEWAPTHIAGLPVAVNIQCHCVRCGEAVI